MKRKLTILIVLITGIVISIYFLGSQTQPKFENSIGVSQPDSTKEKSMSDKISKITPRTKKTIKERDKIPKTIRPDKYAHLDKYAKEVPDDYSRDNEVLAEYLEKPAKNDLEKSRLIYSWIATHIQYDYEAFNTGRYRNENADSVLVRRTAVCDGFSSIFLELGLLMGLEVEKISGYSKGYGYQIGDKFSSTDHAWNAVKIDGTWQLIDVTWGSSDSETTDKGLKSTMRFDPYWFCVPPDEFIFSHLPENKDWQLTSQTISLKQYESLPFINESFFKLGLGSKEVLKKALSGSLNEFVETFSIGYPINASELPLDKTIQRDREYTFSIESEYLENVVIIDGGQWIELKREGNTFKIEHTPKGEKLEISVKINWYDKEFWTIAVYEIVDEKNLTAHNKSYNQWRVMSKYKVLSSPLRLVTVDNDVFKSRHWL